MMDYSHLSYPYLPLPCTVPNTSNPSPYTLYDTTTPQFAFIFLQSDSLKTTRQLDNWCRPLRQKDVMVGTDDVGRYGCELSTICCSPKEMGFEGPSSGGQDAVLEPMTE
ncbi:hypothetical protein Y032_0101g3386 [Ancylostoma ceylanicum]|nr:hypothetical protein Y032_0101g3386 [Ancylostoma ceylanicum]